MLTRRQLLTTAAAAGLATYGGDSHAQAPQTVDGWPSRPVRVLSPTGSGGPSQNFRMYAEHLKDAFGQNFFLENLPGGSGALGLQQVVRSAPDGHSLLLASNSHIVLAPLVLPNFPANYTQFDPIALLFRFRFLLLANHEVPVRTLAELVDYAKKRPGQLNFGSPGVGTGGHLVTELMVKRTGIEAVHVPYQATTQQMMAAAGGTLQFTFDTIGNSRGMVDAGKLIPLAVTGASRAESAPNIPTFKELGYEGFENLFVTNGLLAPKGASPAMIKALNREIVRLNAAGAIPEKLKAAAYEVGTGTAEDYAASLETDHKTWSSIVNETGVRLK
ncbi:MAG TPA: tripartite tricarboxylate transporter substrate binding protein [Xanthobacteraceae bacterium]|nr:tripartite tricarboxylate transporter substrate binding protein [Xanthobacteraceae bacterium]